jgi:hypothetical protein
MYKYLKNIDHSEIGPLVSHHELPSSERSNVYMLGMFTFYIIHIHILYVCSDIVPMCRHVTLKFRLIFVAVDADRFGTLYETFPLSKRLLYNYCFN